MLVFSLPAKAFGTPDNLGLLIRLTKAEHEARLWINVLILKFVLNVCTLTSPVRYLDRNFTILNGSNANAINDPKSVTMGLMHVLYNDFSIGKSIAMCKVEISRSSSLSVKPLSLKLYR